MAATFEVEDRLRTVIDSKLYPASLLSRCAALNDERGQTICDNLTKQPMFKKSQRVNSPFLIDQPQSECLI